MADASTQNAADYVRIDRAVLQVLFDAANKADEADLLGDCDPDGCDICTAMAEAQTVLLGLDD